MLFSVYAIFALFLIQIIVTHLQETGEAMEETAFEDFFGSFGVSILTLYKASTGGDDWSVAYQVIEPAGSIGCFTYLLFIAFVHFALINIITGTGTGGERTGRWPLAGREERHGRLGLAEQNQEDRGSREPLGARR